MSEQDNESRWHEPFRKLKRDAGLLALVLVGALVAMPFIFALGWLISKVPDWLYWPALVLFWVGVLFQDTIKAAWLALRGDRL